MIEEFNVDSEAEYSA